MSLLCSSLIDSLRLPCLCTQSFMTWCKSVRSPQYSIVLDFSSSLSLGSFSLICSSLYCLSKSASKSSAYSLSSNASASGLGKFSIARAAVFTSLIFSVSSWSKIIPSLKLSTNCRWPTSIFHFSTFDRNSYPMSTLDRKFKNKAIIAEGKTSIRCVANGCSG